MSPPVEKFGTVAILLHWLTAIGLVIAIIVGLISGYVDDTALTRATLNAHQSIGIIVFVLAVVRLFWRFTHTAPPLPPGTPTSQKVTAAVTHWTLYALFFAFPVTGYIVPAALDRQITIFGLVDIPRVAPHDFDLSEWAQSLHDNGQYILYALIALHVGAALYHRFILNDGILERMWPERKKRAE